MPIPAPEHRDGGRDRPALRLAAGSGDTRPRVGSVARLARIFNALLICSVTINVMVVATSRVAEPQAWIAAGVAATVWIVAFRRLRREATFARLSVIARFVYQSRAVMLGAAFMSAVAFLVPWLELHPRSVIEVAAVLLIISALWGFLTSRLLDARLMHRVLLVGDGEQVGRFMREFSEDPHPEYRVVGLLTDQDADDAASLPDGDTTLQQIVEMFDGATTDLGGIPVLGTLSDLENVLAAESIDTVVVSVRRNRLDLFSRLSSWEHNITVQELPEFSEQVFGRVPIDVINAAWFMHMIHPFYRPYSRAVKRIVDIMVSLVIGVLALPLLPVIALLVKATSAGPVFYSQVRVGERGREFRIHKFRTMSVDAESSGAQWAARRDPRVTPIGGFLRVTRLDELPQLWNILLGQMSFVGPRPERPEFVGALEERLPYYQRRHLVKPGLTGWAQVRHGYADTVDAAGYKLGYELYYLKHQSLFLDMVILVETVRVVLMRFGSR